MRIVAIIAALFMLAACGGGGSGGRPASMTQQPQQPNQAVVDTDGDGVADAQDAFPNDPAETKDSDGDGVGDNADAFPRDPAETADADGDGVGDVADAFPNDASETMDSDGDGVGDNADAFPNDASRTAIVDRLPFPFAYADDDSNTETLFARHYTIQNLPAVLRSAVKNMPIYTDAILNHEAGPPPFGQGGYRTKVFVGVDQGNIGSLPVTGTRGDSEIRFGQLNDGVQRSELLGYLQEAFAGQSVARWPQAPMVRIVGQASNLDENIVTATVQLINSSLPEGSKVAVGSSLPADAGPIANTIRIKFVPISPRGAGATTFKRVGTNADGHKVVEDSLVEFYKNTNVYADATGTTDTGIASVRRSVILMAHELMHALGFDTHPSQGYATILEGTADVYALAQNGKRQPLSLLYPIDRAALRALYSLEPGTDPSSLGPWASTSRHIHGNGPHAGFGVALRNGYAEPWAYGYAPDSDLADNRALSGSAAWNGELLGLTPDAAVVAGDARVGINLAAMVGQADFTNLETWGAGITPGAEGTGTTWLDGDLGYAIAVRGNTFRETGGDAGRLTGVFTGRSHEGAAGTLERSDLTAAFGAAR